MLVSELKHVGLNLQIHSKMRSHFISEYLTHWTGKGKDDNQGFNNLMSILSNCRLLLSDGAPHFRTAWSGAHLRMTCFTDIPHHLSSEHCQRYGKFGIAFKKRVLIDYGANPVLYLTSLKKDDAEKVYNYICDANTGKIALNSEVLESLKKFFGFVQDYEYGTDTYYYEREWRILQNNLEYCEGSVIQPGKYGSSIQNGKKQYYFQFSQNDVEFLICPKDYVNRLIGVNNKYPILSYEYLIL